MHAYYRFSIYVISFCCLGYILYCVLYCVHTLQILTAEWFTLHGIAHATVHELNTLHSIRAHRGTDNNDPSKFEFQIP